MDVKKVISKLKQQYPGKTIIKNMDKDGVVTEVLCEIKPTQNHPKYSEAIAVIDASMMHFHKKLHETYTVLSGELTIVTDVEHIKLKKGDKITMKPGTVHANIGNETWTHVYSKPGWTLGDHIPLEDLMKQVVAESQSDIKVKIIRALQARPKKM